MLFLVRGSFGLPPKSTEHSPHPLSIFLRHELASVQRRLIVISTLVRSLGQFYLFPRRFLVRNQSPDRLLPQFRYEVPHFIAPASAASTRPTLPERGSDLRYLESSDACWFPSLGPDCSELRFGPKAPPRGGSGIRPHLFLADAILLGLYTNIKNLVPRYRLKPVPFRQQRTGANKFNQRYLMSVGVVCC